MPASSFRTAISGFALVVIFAFAAWMIKDSLADETISRPVDFLQVWSAGRLAITGENPYDGKRMFELQRENRNPTVYASMMWVPPWGLVVAMPMGALPIDLAQAIWVYGQLALIFVVTIAVWRVYGGSRERVWVPIVLVITCGPAWWQVASGQYAGLLFAGIGGYLIAHRKNRPVLAGACLFLIALKPHLFTLFALGLIIDALRTPFGRKVVLGGALVLLAASALVTAVNPLFWQQYRAAATSGYNDYYPILDRWFPPTIQAVIRDFLPGKPMWVQFVPLALIAPVFAVYWWRNGNPDRWPRALVWVVPLQLLVTPYSGWASDLTLLLMPTVLLAVRLDAVGWPIPRRWALAALFLAANIAVPVMRAFEAPALSYAWVTPVVGVLLLWAARGLRDPQPSANNAEETWQPERAPHGVPEPVRG